MSLKTRLALNALFVAISIVAIAVIGLCSLFAIQANINQLTRHSTPLQVKTLKLQRALERVSSTFIRLASSQNAKEARQNSIALSEEIATAHRLDSEINRLNSNNVGLDVPRIQELQQTVSQAVQEKITSVQLYHTEAETVRCTLRETEQILAGIHAQVTTMDGEAADVLHLSQQSNLQLNSSVKRALNLQLLLKEFKTYLAEIEATHSKYHLTPFNDKIKATSDAIQNLTTDGGDPSLFVEIQVRMAKLFEQMTQEQVGLLALRAQALGDPRAEAEYRRVKGSILIELDKLDIQLGELVDPMELQLMKSRQAEDHAFQLQSYTGEVVNEAATIEMEVKELNTQVCLVMQSINLKDLDRDTAGLGVIQQNINADLQALHTLLEAKGESQDMGAIHLAIRQANASADRVVAAKRQMMASDALMQQITERVMALALEQTQSGDLRLNSVERNQDAMVASVDTRVRVSLSWMVVISVLVVVFAIGVSIQLLLGITRPLKNLADTVNTIAKAGDFSQRVTIRVKDEMGRTLEAFNGLMATLEKSQADLSEAEVQLVQSAKLASLGTLSAGVAHELNQPIAIIRGLSQQLQQEPGLSEDVLADLDIIEGQTGRMTKIVKHLRTFCRAGGADFAPVDVNQVVHDCFLLVGQQLRTHNVTAELHLCEEAPPVMADANELEQVFLNLITNARDAMEGRPDATITIRSWVEGGRFVLEFRDNGTGVPDTVVGRIFDPFFTTKDPGKGTGLGLSISHTILKRHQGDIQVYNDHGAVFTITLPLAEVQEIPKAA
ncbi:MAG TPA: ATP-binding protein [Chthonomonadaceae bacterium]|nr:ATP-binding protein [Chthonomonadaceae bacterium]